MSLTIGATVRPPQLPGRWSVWSKADESPGAYFVVPVDQPALDLGAKYAVIRARQASDEANPLITTLRTDPHIEGLLND